MGMTTGELMERGGFEVICEGKDRDREVGGPFCCDLLSMVMGRAPEGCAWVTVMGNLNTLAVASLADVSCVILAEGARLDKAALTKAKEQGVAVAATGEPVFETALKIYRLVTVEAQL